MFQRPFSALFLLKGLSFFFNKSLCVSQPSLIFYMYLGYQLMAFEILKKRKTWNTVGLATKILTEDLKGRIIFAYLEGHDMVAEYAKDNDRTFVLGAGMDWVICYKLIFISSIRSLY